MQRRYLHALALYFSCSYANESQGECLCSVSLYLKKEVSKEREEKGGKEETLLNILNKGIVQTNILNFLTCDLTICLGGLGR